MSNRAALFREREGNKVIAAARKAGAKAVEFRYGDVIAIVRLTESDGASVDANEWTDWKPDRDDAHKA